MFKSARCAAKHPDAVILARDCLIYNSGRTYGRGSLVIKKEIQYRERRFCEQESAEPSFFGGIY